MCIDTSNAKAIHAGSLRAVLGPGFKLDRDVEPAFVERDCISMLVQHHLELAAGIITLGVRVVEVDIGGDLAVLQRENTLDETRQASSTF